MREQIENLMKAQGTKCGKALTKKEAQELLAACKSCSSLSPEAMKKLLKMCSQCKSGLGERLSKLAECKLIDAELLKSLKKCRGCKGCDKAVLLKSLAALCQNGDPRKTEECLRACFVQANVPGVGTPDRGRGDAPMIWQDVVSEKGVKFKEEAIPLSAVTDLKNSRLIGVGLGAPKASETTIPAQPGALAGARAGAGGARVQTILPRHRKAVERYFDRGGDGAK
jgi:hypothetical protein